MDDTLSKFRQKAEEAAEHERWHKPREYQKLLANIPTEIENALAELEKLIPTLKKFIKKSVPEFALNPHDPPSVKIPVDQRQHLLKFHGQRCDTIMPRMQALLGKIQGAKPEDFRHYPVKILADLDREKANSLLSELDMLRALPESIGKLELAIKEGINFLSERNYKPTPAVEISGVASRRPEVDQDKPEPWDPRL